MNADSPILAAAEVTNLHKQFTTPWGRPGVYALKGVSLTIAEGEVYGLIGPNGSGKSTLMKALLGLVHPSEGTCAIFGIPSTDPISRAHVGFLPENPYFYKFLTGRETLRFYGRLCGIPRKTLKAKIDELLLLVGLEEAGNRRIGGYSKGMLQRIGVAQALIQDPRLVILDEPTAGVDPIGSRAIRDIILELKRRGMTVFLCSHLLEQVQEVCDRVGIIYQGVMMAEGSVDLLTEDLSRTEIILDYASPSFLNRMRSLIDQDPDAILRNIGHPHNSLEQVFFASLAQYMQTNQSDKK